MLRNNMPLLIIISIITIAAETSVARLYSFLYPGPKTLDLNLTLFGLGIVVFSVVQVLIIIELRRQTRSLFVDRGRRFQFIFAFTIIVQFILTGLLFVVLVETLVFLSYKTYLVIVAILLNYIPSIIYLSILYERFIRWLIDQRNYISLLFGFSTVGILVNSLFSALYVVII